MYITWLKYKYRKVRIFQVNCWKFCSCNIYSLSRALSAGTYISTYGYSAEFYAFSTFNYLLRPLYGNRVRNSVHKIIFWVLHFISYFFKGTLARKVMHYTFLYLQFKFVQAINCQNKIVFVILEAIKGYLFLTLLDCVILM